MSGIRLCVLFLAFLIVPFYGAKAQCVSPISSFPFTENFELSNGGWTVGGNAPDWAWGTPAKSVITGAGQGNKCWIVGNLTGNTYNPNELSWLQSPCFNISSLSNPRVSFLVFWDSEFSYDGALLQYSTDGGNTWMILGDQNSNANCLGSNWYNHPSIRYLNGFKPGWSGSVSTNCGSSGGSGTWLQASHSLASLSSSTSIIFRFLFGAGSVCNDFNGFAIDNFRISEAPPAGSVDFSGVCSGNGKISFTNLSLQCRASVVWNFGDPASGSANTASGDTATHLYGTPGTYPVTMTVTFNNGQSSSVTKEFTILAVTADVIKEPSCSGSSDGEVVATAQGNNGPVFYAWNTNPPKTTASVTGLPAGTYTVNISALNACPAEATVVLSQPDTISPGLNVVNEICGNASGSISLQPAGGTAPYAFSWSSGSSSSSISSLAAGNYSVTITDSKGCAWTSGNILVGNTVNSVTVSLGGDRFICAGEFVVLDPGAFTSYRWQDGSTSRTFTANSTGRYEVEVTDANGCRGIASVNVTADCADIYFPSTFTPNGDGLNESFGALGNVNAVHGFKMRIFNRLGQEVFATDDISKKWNGKFAGRNPDSQVFAWFAEYSIFNRPLQIRKGTVLLLR